MSSHHLLSLVISLMVTTACSARTPSPSADAAAAGSIGLKEAEAFYATRPPEEQPQAGWQAPPEGLTDLRAASCGECHREIYAEWRRSTHALAWVDPQLQTEMKKSGNRWLCNNCHTPLLNQMERWAVALEGGDVERPTYVSNPNFDPAFRDEGITCASCHVRDGTIEGPTGVATDAHATREAPRFRDQRICLTCHQAVRRYPGKDFICTFKTGEEWAAGPFGQANIPCQSCHMKIIERPAAEGAPVRTGHMHAWPGGGIYKREGFGPSRDLLPPGLSVSPQATAEALTLTLSNTSGHKLPTGDPERHILVDVTFFSATGALVDGEQIRMGQHWKWWPEPVQISDNRLGPGEHRVLRLKRPPTAKRWRVTATNRRISEEGMAFHREALAKYPVAHVVYRGAGVFPAVDGR